MAVQIDLSGQVALITGGASGIGRGVARLFLQSGARVAIAGRSEARLQAAVAALESPRLSAHRCDVADPRAVEQLVQELDACHGGLDALVCSHGIYPGTRSMTEITLESFDAVMAINVRGTFLCAQAAGRGMLARGRGGRIIFISSMNALLAQEGAADYDASKAAVHGLTRALAVELGSAGITVNAIAPGWVRTEMSAEELGHLSDRHLNPAHRVGEPEDIARAALWLADPGNGYVTGSVVTVDGGQTAMLATPWPSAEHAPDEDCS